MKLFRKLGWCLSPWILLLSACVQTPTYESQVALYQHATEEVDLSCRTHENGYCNIRVAQHLPVRTEQPAVTVVANKSVRETGRCLSDHLQRRFKLPAEFFQITSYADGSENLALVNPFTKIKGLQMDVVSQGILKSQISLYANNMELSKAWLNLPASCR